MRACPAISPAANRPLNLGKVLIFRDACGLYVYQYRSLKAGTMQKSIEID
jgi:hypothetical protein